MQNGQPATIPSSSYGVPLTCVCAPNQNAGLGAYGSGVSTMPTIGQSPGQTTVYNVPGMKNCLKEFLRIRFEILIKYFSYSFR